MQKVFGATSCVLMGFLHPEDLAEELKVAALLNPQIAAAIADAINKRVFVPIREDIDKVFDPPTKMGVAPKILQDIGPASLNPPRLYSAPSVAQLVAPTNPQKASLPETGWSRLTHEQPVIKLSQTSGVPPQAPSASPRMPSPASRSISAQDTAKTGMGEFERLAAMKNIRGSVPPGASQTLKKPEEPAPIIIHEDATFKPQQQTPDFHLVETPKSFDMGKIGSGPAPIRPAVLEFGGGATPSQAPKAPPQPPKSNMVHYSEYIAKNPQTPGSRQISEVTSGTIPSPNPAPTPTPAPAPIPKPPIQPPAPASPKPGETKIIYKDYTASPRSETQTSPSTQPLSPPKPPSPPAPPTK